MENENPKFYIKALGELRKIAHDLIQSNHESIHDSRELFILEIDGIMVAIQRNLQFMQLHLDENAVVFMDHLQSELVQLSEECNTFILSDKKSQIEPDVKEYLLIMLEAINNIFDHLKDHYNYCFNFKMVVPVRYKQKTDLTLIKISDKLIQSFKSAGIDEGLCEILKGYFLEMKNTKKTSFHLLDFWYALIHDLNKVSSESIDENELDLRRVFCYHNFNYPPLIQYYISRLQLDYNEVDNYREEYIKITVEIRKLRQLIIRRRYSYDSDAVELREVLCHTLENELVCIKKLINMNKKIFEGSGTKYFLQQFYFKISISMEQFLFIFRLLIDKGIVLVKRKADLYEFIHAHVGTAKKENLSIGNMQNTYAENNRVTAIKVKALLQSLIKQIDEKYLSLFCILITF
ncbi:hypothetical protein H7U22_03640 [Pedobacter sp. CCM 8938]|uniref:RteC protein n=2 Tax=Pedobacter fastidiosus TaxID=2765361 RepID=A0ABR7KNQ7_9SPHI|nr:hypothetical protein [Pedobacter fastidiosus]MBC6109505.1 hypothetical protein [Pedobacter fastidiosus]